MTCPCGRSTLTPPCFYCLAGTSESAQAEVKAAKRLSASGAFVDPLTGCMTRADRFTLISDESGNLFCFPGMWKRAGKGETVGVWESLGISGRWYRRDTKGLK